MRRFVRTVMAILHLHLFVYSVRPAASFCKQRSSWQRCSTALKAGAFIQGPMFLQRPRCKSDLKKRPDTAHDQHLTIAMDMDIFIDQSCDKASQEQLLILLTSSVVPSALDKPAVCGAA